MSEEKDDSKSKLMTALEAALTKELKLLSTSNDPETQKPYTLTAKSKVWDRILKLEAIKLKVPDAEYGTGFVGGEPS
jgi:hypothetical protein